MREHATSTLVPPFPSFPVLLPTPPRPHHLPLGSVSQSAARRISGRRDLVQEIDDLSDEENELDDLRSEIKNRGSSWFIPIGKQLTLQEEKNDASSSSSESGTVSNGPPSNADDVENESAADLDASMVDLDDPETNAEEGTGNETGDVTGEQAPSETADLENMQD